MSDRVVRLVIVDDQPVLRAGLRAILTPADNIDIVGEASTPEGALQQIIDTRCDLVLVDLTLPLQNGIRCIKQLKEVCPHVLVVAFTRHVIPEVVTAALEAGASGYVLKTAGREEIVRALHQVARSGGFLPSSVAQVVVHQFRTRRSSPDKPARQISDRERTILSGLAQGLSNTEIAARLSVSLATVKAQLRTLYQKFETSDRTQLTILAMKEGHLEAASEAEG